MSKKFNSFLKQFLKFSIVGLSNTFVSFAVTYGSILITRYFFKEIPANDPVLVFLATFLGFAVGVLNSYYWNNKYVFTKTKGGNLVPLLKSYACYGVIFILSYILNAFVFTKIFNLPNILIPVLQIFICTPLNFLANKLWAFKWLFKILRL